MGPAGVEPATYGFYAMQLGRLGSIQMLPGLIRPANAIEAFNKRSLL